MSARDLGTIVLRVFALYLLIHAISSIPGLASVIADMRQSLREGDSLFDSSGGWQQELMLSGVVWPVVLFATVGIGLLKGAPRLAARLVPADGDVRGSVVLGEGLQAVAISVVGVWMLATAVPRVAGTVMTFALAAKYRGTPFEFQYWERPGTENLVALGVWIFMGLWLCLGARGIANVVRSFAAAGPAGRADGASERRGG